jgi:hypothetical protein
MPTYPYKCICGQTREVIKPLKELDKTEFCECGLPMGRTIAGKGGTHIFKAEVWEHITEKPVFIRSKAHLKEVCKKHGVIATGYM